MPIISRDWYDLFAELGHMSLSKWAKEDKTKNISCSNMRKKKSLSSYPDVLFGLSCCIKI